MKSAGRVGDMQDVQFMQRALALAHRGLGRTRPNPPVGAVVVRSGRIVGEGYHRRAGGPHAEAVAIAAAGAATSGATLYVTLEPCSTWGRTPPCTDLIRKAGVRRVVVGCLDPNPRHAGHGLRVLRRSGLAVVEGVLREEAELLIAPFRKWITTGYPFVTLKLAESLDGRIADREGRSQWISGEAARREVQRLRASADVVLVGWRTVRADDPSLQCRGARRAELHRVVVDSQGRLPLTARVVSDADRTRTIVATTARSPRAFRQTLGQRGVRVWVLPQRGGRVRLRHLMKKLGQAGFLHVLCEGGATLAAGLLEEKMVDALVFFVAPRILGGTTSLPAVTGAGWRLAHAPRLRFADWRRIGPDLMISAHPEF